MGKIDDAVTTLYRDEDLAAFAFALTGSVEGATALMRAAVRRSVARRWRLTRGLDARVRRDMIRLHCAAVRRGDDGTDLNGAPSGGAWRGKPDTDDNAAPPPSPAPAAPPGETNPFAPPEPARRVPAPVAAPVARAPGGPDPYAPPGQAPTGSEPHDRAEPATPSAEFAASASPDPASAAPAARAAPPHPIAQPSTELSEVDHAVAALPADIRTALALRYLADYDTRAIGRALKLPREDVDQLLEHGRHRLAGALGVSPFDVERVVIEVG